MKSANRIHKEKVAEIDKKEARGKTEERKAARKTEIRIRKEDQMLSNELKEIVSNLKRRLLMPYLQGLMTVAVYIVIAYYLDTDKTQSTEVDKVLLYAFSTMSALVAIGSVIIPRWFFSSKRIDTMLKKDYGPGDWWDHNRIKWIVGKNLELIKKLTKKESRICAMLHWTFKYHHIFMAMPELIGVWGLVLSMFSQDYRYAVVFSIVALPLKLMLYPRIESIAQEAEMQIERKMQE